MSVVEEQVENLAIVTDGSGGYLVVEILGKADTYAEAKEILDEALEEEDEEGDDEEEDDEDDSSDSD